MKVTFPSLFVCLNRLRALPALARPQAHRRTDAGGFDADETPIVLGVEIADRWALSCAGIPHHGIGETRHADRQGSFGCDQAQRPWHVEEDRIHLAWEPQRRVRRAAFDPACSLIEIAQPGHALDVGGCHIRHGEIGMQRGCEGERRRPGVGDSQSDRQLLPTQRNRQLGQEGMGPEAVGRFGIAQAEGCNRLHTIKARALEPPRQITREPVHRQRSQVRKLGEDYWDATMNGRAGPKLRLGTQE